MDESRLELKVGAMAAVALAVAAVLLASLGHFGSSRRYTLNVDFTYAGGLPAGAVVKIAGVKVGRVREVQFRPDAKDDLGRVLPVRLVLDVDRDAARALRRDAVATVATQGALGESYVEIVPGSTGEPLEEGSTLRGLDPPRLDVVLARLFSVLDSAATDEAFRSFLVSLAGVAENLNSFLSNHHGEIGAALQEVVMMIEDGRQVVRQVNGIARDAQDLLGTPELKTAIRDLATVASSAKKDLLPLLADTRALVTRLDSASEKIGPEDVAKIKTSLARLEQMTATVDTILAAVEKGEGTLGGLYRDPKVYEDLRALLDDVKSHPWKLVWKK